MNNKSGIWKIILGGLALVIIGSMVGVGLYKAWFETPARAYYLSQPAFASSESPYRRAFENSQGETGPSFVDASRQARPAVVHIRSSYAAKPSRERREEDFFSNPFHNPNPNNPHRMPYGAASGSGVIISADGYITTNNHVIEDAEVIEVTLFDNRKYEAKLIGRDISTDLALVKIEAEGLPFLAFGDSESVEVGQWVLAVGNPMDLTSTVTAGIVSAKSRNINLLRADSRYAIESFIQTDAAVNKGNSGGALVDEYGTLIGINTAIASRTGYFSGYSFAIPASIAKKVMEDFVIYGEVRRGFLGVQIQAMNAELAELTGLDVVQGAYVSSVNDDLGAADAGIRKGDVIISVNDNAINNSSELQEQVSRYRPGDKLKLVAMRNGREKIFIVLLKALNGAGMPLADRKSSIELKGSLFRLLTEEEANEFGLSQGVMVENAGSSLEDGGIESGLIILEMDGTDIFTIEDLEAALIASGDFVTIKGMYEPGRLKSYSFDW